MAFEFLVRHKHNVVDRESSDGSNRYSPEEESPPVLAIVLPETIEHAFVFWIGQAVGLKSGFDHVERHDEGPTDKTWKTGNTKVKTWTNRAGRRANVKATYTYKLHNFEEEYCLFIQFRYLQFSCLLTTGKNVPLKRVAFMSHPFARWQIIIKKCYKGYLQCPCLSHVYYKLIKCL